MSNPKTFWQRSDDDCSVPEPALSIHAFLDVVEVRQDRNVLLLNVRSFEDFVRTVRAAIKTKRGDK